jgi:hypothetical protein
MGETASTTTEPAPEPRADATPVARLARRDAGIALAALSLFGAADAWHAATGLGFAALLALVNGAVVGWVLGTLAHEWGHFAGARLSGGIAPTRAYRSLFPIFDLDLDRSDPAAFRAMSVAGNVAHWGIVLALALLVPMDAAGRQALVCGAFAFAVAASTTEVPIIQRAFAGTPPKQCFAGLTGAKLARDRRIGAAAGLALFLVV